MHSRQVWQTACGLNWEMLSGSGLRDVYLNVRVLIDHFLEEEEW